MPTLPLHPASRSPENLHGHGLVGAWIADLVAAQAVSRPEVIAATCGSDALTYGELNRRADELAQCLRRADAGPDVVIAMCLRRSLAMIVGALGILKAGAAYLPLDPALPIARLRFVLQDAQPAAVVTDESVAARLALSAHPVLMLDATGRLTRTELVGAGAMPATTDLVPENLAYVIYTSGSTGQPKGVEITHGSLQNLICWHQGAFTVTPQDLATQLASPGFDAAVWEVWPYLTAGATLSIPDDDTVGVPERLRDWLVHQAITISFVPTPMAERLLGLEWPSSTSLRCLLTGADVLRRYPPATLPFKVVNNYGPTECAVVTTSGTVLPGRCSNGLPSIGYPITGAEVYILDEHLRPVPQGQSGELYIGGVGLARGYRNRADLTAERFISHRFGEGPELRLYKTGDMASWLASGEIAFGGRTDDQVKIHGYRIELQEIAAALEQHPMVDASVVIADEHIPGEKRLLAYVVPQIQAELTDRSLREFLLLNLPEYMVPAAFCRIDALPLNSSGKVDRKALPRPMDADLLASDEYVAPRTPAEEQLAKLLCSLLRVERVGVKDDFFLLGGNSLLGAQVIARVRDVFAVDLPLLSLFDHPTISELADEIEQLIVTKVQAMSDDEATRIAAD
jgi:amino acid adenylation domain-containing protein